MPGRVNHLFVYGTLRRGSDNEFAHLLADRAQFVGSARVQGQLYDFGRYPGAVTTDQPDQCVRGEVHRLRDTELLARLDEYEGPEFERAVAVVQTDDGRTIDCSIYWYVGDATGRLIASGDWLKR
jgi:gamma-glutamylcyclotransferase (GGCT)/AIG2-like uncharacterized protein YtfP